MEIPRAHFAGLQLEGGDTLRFVAKCLPVAIANGVRRALLADLPGFALQCGAFEHNDTGLPTAFLAQRMELVPLHCCRAAAVVADTATAAVPELYSARAPPSKHHTPVDAARVGLPATHEHTLLAWLPPAGGTLAFRATVTGGRGGEHAKFKVASDACGWEEEEEGGPQRWAVETVGGVHPATLFTAALQSLRRRCEAYATSHIPTAVQLRDTEEFGGVGTEVLLPRESPTLGELLTRHLRSHPRVLFAGYCRVTFADAGAGLRLHVATATGPMPYAVMAEAAAAAASEVASVEAAWREAVSQALLPMRPHAPPCPYAGV